MKRVLLKRVLLMLGAVALVASCSSSESRSESFQPMVVGDRAPAYTAVTLAGDSVHVGAGTPILLNVWATWCESCREEMADLAQLSRKYAARGIKVVAVSVDKGDDTRVKRFAAAEKLPFTVAHDASGEVENTFQAVGVPETYLVAGDGTLVWVRRGGLAGAPTEIFASLDSAVAKLGR